MVKDASECAYGALVCLKVTSDAGAQASVVMGKSPVVSISRLELTAALVATKLARIIQEESDFTELSVFFWKDSMTGLR